MTTTVVPFVYSDGSSNGYQLSQSGELIYSPVTPAESSSGVYDGGPSWRRTLTQGEQKDLLALLLKANAATDQHEEQRSMGTGSVSIAGAPPTILKMSSPLRKEIEAKLKSLAP
jgi:hypothetical protein